MKKLIFVLIAFLLVVAANETMAQAGRLKTLAVDTLKGNNNQTLGEIPVSGGYSSLAIKVKIDRISTAAGGTIYLKSGLDSASVQVENQSTNPNLAAYPNDTLATSDVATQYVNFVIPSPGNKTYHIFGDGDASDTVKVTTSYFFKR